MRTRAALPALLLAACAIASPASGETAEALFRKGLQAERSAGAEHALALYRQAGELGLADAQFNVGLMLDSGRGGAVDREAAALWYARAAAHGHRRAAFNLGLLYEAGNGVPRNGALARAWYAASGLPAALARLGEPDSGSIAGAVLSEPRLLFPPAGAQVPVGASAVELVWSAPSQPVPVQFYVEVFAEADGRRRELFSDFVKTSSVSLVVPRRGPASLSWRVMTVGGSHYRASPWQTFRLPAE
jgi:hypothetical protein